MFYLLQKTFDQSNLPKPAEGLCDPLDENKLNNWAYSQTLMPKSANHNKLATLQTEYVNCPKVLTTYM